MNRKNNIIVLVIFSAVFFLITLMNLLQPTRETYSEEEKRELATFPEFSFETFTSGKFFSGIDDFIADTFIFRNELIGLSRKITALWSANTFLNIGEDEIIFIPSQTVSTDEIPDSPLDLIVKNDQEKDEQKEEETVKDEPIIDENNSDTPENDEVNNSENTETDTESTDTQVQGEDSETQKDLEEEKSEDNIISEEIPSDNTEPSEATATEEPIPGENLTEISDPHGVGEPEFLSSGEIIYNGAVISIPYLVPSVAQYYADVVSYYKYLFPDSRVNVLCAPLSSAMVDEPKLKKKITDQDKMIDTINSYLSDDINGVNCFDELYSHRNEYLYFKSDHHWTSRGAYYAYVAFAESVGLTPTPLENFTEVLMNSAWNGSMYSMTGDERIKEITDEVYAYVSTKKHTMTTYNSNGNVNKFNTSILTNYGSYNGFIDGDNAYTVINVPENPQDMTILVFKDSYGNAFVPYLVEHYGTIIVVDPRYIYFDIYEHLKDYKLTDILFVNNLYNPNVVSYPKNLMRAIGQ